MKRVTRNGKTSSAWSKEAITREKKEIREVRKIFASKGITGEDACKMILATRRGGGYEL